MIELVQRRLEGYITATKHVMLVYNVGEDLLQEAMKITPGKRSPTVTMLDDGSSRSVSSLVLKKEVNQKMDELHKLGATDILAIGLTNSRM